ncbi:MAG TPA: heavy metal translocating P-type ATPase [Thermoanaerobaculaceae bacterium]|nr:heavy metal translocating P-type ATPase [Acidobacteriota bacterium]HPW54330.1 heavy metal translocating P-type ATPase [Thermoanaerobaculaceae bacterium]
MVETPARCALGPGVGCCSAPPMAASDRAAWWRIGIGAVIAANSMTIDLAINTSEADPRTRLLVHLGVLVATATVIALLGAPLLAAAWRQARQWRLTLEAMFVLAISGSLVASLVAMTSGEGAVYFEVAAVLLVVYSLGQQLGGTAQRRALDAVERWQRELATCQLVSEDGQIRSVPVAEVQVGRIVEVQPGRLIPVDGVITNGESFVREATLTGEHLAVVRRSGDRVWAGTHAVDGLLRVEATSPGSARRIDGILAAVERARAVPGRLQRTADRFIGVFLPLVSAVAVLTGLGWGVARGPVEGVFNAMSVLLVACPCALGLATPLAVWRALAALAQRGLVPHTGDAIERLAGVRTVVMDKTGTITESRSRLVDLVVAADSRLSSAELRALLARVEAGNPHPLAAAFADSSGETSTTWLPARVRLVPGVGIEAEVTDATGRSVTVAIGTPTRVCASSRHSIAWDRLRSHWHTGARGQEIAVLVDGELTAAALVGEQPRPGWSELRARLAAQRVGLVVMSGDPEAARVGLGETEILAGLGPEDKLDRVLRLEADGQHVLFVGDGVNDAAAMAASHVSIAVGEGAELANDVASFSWHGHHLADLVAGLEASRAAVGTIRSNLGFAAAYNLTGVALAAAGALHPIVAALLMTCSSLIVTWRAAGLGGPDEEPDEVLAPLAAT